MPEEIIRSYLVNPFLYGGGSFCCGCNDYLPGTEFFWVETGQNMAEYNQDLKDAYLRVHGEQPPKPEVSSVRVVTDQCLPVGYHRFSLLGGLPMRTMALVLTAGLTVSLAQADPPRAEPAVPAGKWSVEFSNGVVEKVEIKKDGTATVSEPARSSDGKVTSTQGSFLFVCEDGRVERWTPVGKRMVVEHWASADQFPNGAPVKGIAEITD